MEAQLPDPSPSLTELRAVGGAFLTRLAELRERDVAVPDELWRAAGRFEPLLDGVDPEREEAVELWELALTLPGLLAQAEPLATAAGRPAEGGPSRPPQANAEPLAGAGPPGLPQADGEPLAGAGPAGLPADGEGLAGAEPLGECGPGGLALSIPAVPVPAARLFVRDGVEHVESRRT